MTKPAARTRFNKPTKIAVLSDLFLFDFHECFTRYRNSKERARLLAGLSPDLLHGKMTVRSAVVLVCCVAAARGWRSSEWRIRRYRDARWRSEQSERSQSRYVGVEAVRKQMTISEINRVEALTALSFSQHAGYQTHSRALWKSIEGALCTDGLGDAPRAVRSRDDVDELFEKIRLRLYHQRRLKGEAVVNEEAKGIYRELLLKLRDKTLRSPEDQLLLNAVHRRV